MYRSSALQDVVAIFEAINLSGLTLFQEQRSSAAMKGITLFMKSQVKSNRYDYLNLYKH
jgi:hypothetical protein